MAKQNTPKLETDRLILRKFANNDIEALFSIFSDKTVNTYLPWFPLSTIEEANDFYEDRYLKHYETEQAYNYAVCLKDDDIPIGYINVNTNESRDLGYGLKKEFWNRGIITEACQKVLQQVRNDGFLYVTATHDINNPASGRVMQKLGMIYQYTYEEQWQPKDIIVRFRMYQLNFDGNNHRVFKTYWDKYPVHFVEAIG